MNRLTRCYFVACFVLTCLLAGCGPEPKAPEPTVNLHPHEFTKLKISVEPGSGVDNVEVYTTWVVTNLGCAPVYPDSGASVTKQVNTNEKVTKQGDQYIAAIVSDRFLPDKCRWEGGVYGINFMHGKTLLGVVGIGPHDFRASKTAQFICIPPPQTLPVCDSIKYESFDKNRFKRTFNVSVEIDGN